MKQKRYTKNQSNCTPPTWKAQLADLAIANSEAGRLAALQRGFPADRLVVVPNGIDLGCFRPDAAARARARARRDLPDDVAVIGQVGRVDPIKDHPTFLAGLARLRDGGAAFQAIITDPADDTTRTGLTAQLARLGLQACARVLPAHPDIADA
jgi:glycosyltransferase involved in cell wall biosynthesis